MSDVKTAPKIGDLYVHIDEDGNAISVAMNGGRPGAWQGISIARMKLPDEHKTREQINALAKQFAASSDMLAELERLYERHGYQSTASVIAKAKGLKR